MRTLPPWVHRDPQQWTITPVDPLPELSGVVVLGGPGRRDGGQIEVIDSAAARMMSGTYFVSGTVKGGSTGAFPYIGVVSGPNRRMSVTRFSVRPLGGDACLTVAHDAPVAYAQAARFRSKLNAFNMPVSDGLIYTGTDPAPATMAGLEAAGGFLVVEASAGEWLEFASESSPLVAELQRGYVVFSDAAVSNLSLIVEAQELAN